MYTCPLYQPPLLPSSPFPFLSCEWVIKGTVPLKNLFQTNSFGLKWSGVNFHAFWGSNSAKISTYGRILKGRIFPLISKRTQPVFQSVRFSLAIATNEVLSNLWKTSNKHQSPSCFPPLVVCSPSSVRSTFSISSDAWCSAGLWLLKKVSIIMIITITIATFLCAQLSWLSRRPASRAVPWSQPVMQSFFSDFLIHYILNFLAYKENISSINDNGRTGSVLPWALNWTVMVDIMLGQRQKKTTCTGRWWSRC